MKKNIKNSIQYISDLHVDCLKPGNIPIIEPEADNLIIAGDIGVPSHVNFDLLLKNVSKNFERTFVVLGNHDFDLGCCYDKNNYNKWKPYINDLFSKYNNLTLLDNSTYDIGTKYVILGSTFWCNAVYNEKYKENKKYWTHIEEHEKHVEWLNGEISENLNKKVIVVTHFLPSFQMIEDKYRKKGMITDINTWYASDYEHIIKPPIIAWIGGHSHSIMECKINDIYCGINALGYPRENNKVVSKLIDLDFL